MDSVNLSAVSNSVAMTLDDLTDTWESRLRQQKESKTPAKENESAVGGTARNVY